MLPLGLIAIPVIGEDPSQEILKPMSEIASKEWNRTAVRCLASYKANERPVSFIVGDHEIEVRTIVKSWREPDYVYFKVETEDGGLYEIRCNEYEDSWEVRESAPHRQDQRRT